MVDFKALKAARGKKSLESVTAELEKMANEGGRSKDDRFWNPTVDKAGNGYAVIRFLPATADEDVSFVRVFDHGFQGPGGWYIENSLTTIGKDDPCSEYNSLLWNSTTDDKAPAREQARAQKRRLHFISNIYVVSDPSNPANDGKVFLFKYGKKLFKKLSKAMEPQFADIEAFNPFDLWTGANLKLRICKEDGYRSYNDSEFDKCGPLLPDDKKLEAIWNSEYPLTPFLAETNFKSYDELKKRLIRVLGTDTSTALANILDGDTEEEAAPATRTAAAKKTKAATVTPADEDDDNIDFFKNLAS
jgi:hypothetical protein